MERPVKIENVILFYSKFSKECGPCVEYITSNKIPANLIVLDNKADRHLATHGQLVQIKNVPSLLVAYEDKSVQLFVGKFKIISWFESMFTPSSPPKMIENNDEQHKDHRQPRTKSKSKKQKPPKKSQPKRHIVQEDEETQLVFQEDDETETSVVGFTETLGKPGSKNIGISTQANPKPSNSSLMEKVKQMMAERQDTLGYKIDV